MTWLKPADWSRGDLQCQTSIRRGFSVMCPEISRVQIPSVACNDLLQIKKPWGFWQTWSPSVERWTRHPHASTILWDQLLLPYLQFVGQSEQAVSRPSRGYNTRTWKCFKVSGRAWCCFARNGTSGSRLAARRARWSLILKNFFHFHDGSCNHSLKAYTCREAEKPQGLCCCAACYSYLVVQEVAAIQKAMRVLKEGQFQFLQAWFGTPPSTLTASCTKNSVSHHFWLKAKRENQPCLKYAKYNSKVQSELS